MADAAALTQTATSSATATTLKLDDNNPWPGLASYDETATRYFHGRDPDSAELRRLIKRSAFVTLYGKSGLGKSSLLQAGVFPALRADRFLPVYLRLDYTEGAQTPLLAQAALRLAEEAALAHADAAEPEPGEGLWAYLQRADAPIWTADNYPLTPVLVFDQFEELFSRGGSPEHVKEVLDSLADLVGNRLPADLADKRDDSRKLNLRAQQYHVVLSFRSDFLAEVETWAKQASLPRRETMHLTAMSRELAVRAVEKAGAAVVEPGVAERIVDFLLGREGSAAGQSSEVEPVLLSLCCYQLNVSRQRAGQAHIDTGLVDSTAEGILKSFYEDALEGMPPGVAEFIEDNLILGERYRNSYPLAAALEPGKLDNAQLDHLIHKRLLRVDPQGNEPRVELIHDRVVTVVRDARDARRARLAQERERAAAALEAQEELDRLEREREAAEQARLVEIERERSEHAERARGLEEALRKKAERSLRNVSLALAAAVIATAGAGYMGWQSELKSRELAKKSKDIESFNNDATEALVTQVEAAKNETLEVRRQLEQTKVELAAYQLWSTKDRQTRAEAQQVINQAQQVRTMLSSREPLPRSTGNTLKISDWRLTSGACNKGEVTVSGDATFTVAINGDKVDVSQAFVAADKGFTVRIKNPTQTLARAQRTKAGEFYDIDTEAEWNGRGQRFTTQSVERLFVNDKNEPVKVYLIRIRTDCSN
jgi:hypothetical protein